MSTAAPRSTGWFVRRYGPFVAIASAVALVIGLAPTTTPSRTSVFSGYNPGSPGSQPGAGPSPPGVAGAPVDCSRQSFLGPNAGCRPGWTGADNGGSTYKGVSASSVNLVFYEAPSNQQLNSITQAAGQTSSQSLEDHTINVYADFFSRNFQTYGRHVNVEIFNSQAQLGDSSGARADAVATDQQYHAFVSVGSSDVGGTGDTYLDETSRRGIANIAGNALPQSFYAAHAPFVFGMLPSTDTSDAMVAEYIAKRLGTHSRARFGGADSNPPVNGQPRRYGILYPTTNLDGTPSIYSRVGDDLSRRLAKEGIPTATKIGYALDVNTAEQQATNAAQQMKAAKVTTVVCLCDPFSPIFGSKAATEQGYFPEWLQTGYLLGDSDFFARQYDPRQWEHDFGVSSLPVAQKPQDSQWWKAYKSIDPTTDPPLDAPLDFYSLLLAFSGLEGAGPRLDPRTFADGMFRIRLLSNSPYVPSFFYRTTDYGGIKDVQEVWWDPKTVAPDGQPGHYQSVDGGHRYLPGLWPATPTNVFDPRCLPLGSCGASNAP